MKDNVPASLYEGYLEVADVVVSACLEHMLSRDEFGGVSMKDNVRASMHEGYVEVAKAPVVTV